jgi:DNA-binding beta-propeller fold protein YncE
MAESQPTPVSDATFSQELLAEFLLQQSLVTPEQLEDAKDRLQATVAPEAIPLGNAFVGAADGKSLLVVDPRKGTVQSSVALFAGDPGDGQETPPGWGRYSGGQLVVVDDVEQGVRRWLPTGHYPRLGVIPTREGAFLYTGEEPRREYSPRIQALPSPYLNPPGASGPLDLFPAPGGEYVLAANRGAGTVHVVLTSSQEQRGAVSVRPAGHAKGIGVAISPDGRTIYLSDGLTPRLAVLDVATFKVRHQLFPTGPLGSMAMHPDGSSLLVSFTKGTQEMGLMTLSLPDLRVRHLINLPGKGEGDRPNLPLVSGEDPTLAYLVTYSFETRDAQYLLVIDRAKHRVVKTHALKDMPLAVAFNAPAAWCPEPPDLGDILVEMGVLAEDNLRFARTQLRGSGDEAPLTLGNVPINPAILAQLPERLIRDRGVIPLNQLDGQLVVAMANPRDPRSRQFVQDLAGEATVRAIPMSPAEFELFMEERYPKLMEQFYLNEGGDAPAAEPPAPAPAPRAAEPAPVAAPAPAPRELTATVPPVGAAKPQAAAQPLSFDEWGNLPGNHFLMINPLKRQVAELDRTGKAYWLYSPEGDTLTRQLAGFVHAARLPNGNALVVDAGSHRVLEVTPAKEIAWQTSEEARLKGPRHAARLANGNTLVVDTGNNRLVEIDKAGAPSWAYGEMGCSGNGLFKPGHALVLPTGRILIADTGNHRVIEVDPAKGVVWQYGNASNRLGAGQGSGPNQLHEPSSAVRLPNGHTLIVDAGNQRVVEVDAMGAAVWTYKPASVQGGRGVKDPMLAMRLPDGNTLVAGRQGICEVSSDLTLSWEYHLVPPAGPATNPATSTRKAEAPAAVPEGLRVAAEADVPVHLPGRFLQADRANHRIWEVDREKEIVWQYTGLGTAGSETTALDRPHYARRLRNGHTLITDTGHHRVIEVTAQGTIAWQFGQKGKLGNGPKHLANPRSAERLTNGHTLIADQSNKRVIEVSMAGEIVWSFEGATQRLQAPTYATMLANGHLLIVDWGGHIVYEVTTKGKVVWSYGQFGASGADHGLLFHPEYAYRLPSGNTMIADTQNHRVVEVTPQGEIVWQYGGQPAYLPRVGRFGMQFVTPIAAWRLPNGHVVVQHAGKGHVVEVDKDLNILFQFAP